MKIELGKEYRTRDGREVRIYAVDGGGAFPVHGAYVEGARWQQLAWSEHGAREDDAVIHPLDLIPAPVTREMWAGIWPNDVVTIFPSRLSAECRRNEYSIACVPVTITYTPGEGL